MAARGIPFARGRLQSGDVQIVHAATMQLDVEGHDDDGVVLARGQNLSHTANTPMAWLQRTGREVLDLDTPCSRWSTSQPVAYRPI